MQEQYTSLMAEILFYFFEFCTYIQGVQSTLTPHYLVTTRHLPEPIFFLITPDVTVLLRKGHLPQQGPLTINSSLG